MNLQYTWTKRSLQRRHAAPKVTSLQVGIDNLSPWFRALSGFQPWGRPLSNSKACSTTCCTPNWKHYKLRACRPHWRSSQFSSRRLRWNRRWELCSSELPSAQGWLEKILGRAGHSLWSDATRCMKGSAVAGSGWDWLGTAGASPKILLELHQSSYETSSASCTLPWQGWHTSRTFACSAGCALGARAAISSDL